MSPGAYSAFNTVSCGRSSCCRLHRPLGVWRLASRRSINLMIRRVLLNTSEHRMDQK